MNSTQPVSTETLLQQLRWRYATKKFDPTRKIAAPDWAALEESLRLTPSSFGLMPYKFVVVSDPATREKLVPHAWGQRQIAEASHLVVFAIQKDLKPDYVEHYLEVISSVRGVAREQLETYRGMMLGALFQGPLKNQLAQWATFQAYIAIGNFMTGAALLGVDTCPIEGFEPPKFDEILGLPALGLAAVVCCVAGYRAADDKYASVPKVRLPASELFVRL